MAGFVHNANHGQLSIAASSTVALMEARWRCTNLARLESRMVRGSSLIVPTVVGRRTRARLIDELTVSLEMVVTGGATDTSGTATSAANWYTQLATNTRVLKVIANPPATQAGYTATYTAAGQSALTAAVFVENFEVEPDPESGGRFNNVTFDLVIPAGTWSGGF